MAFIPASLSAVREFDKFDAGNDPHHEHDFGAIDLHGQKWFWKFDYYASDMRRGSDDPADIGKTQQGAHHHACQRVLSMRTIVIDGRQYDWKEIRRLRRSKSKRRENRN